MTEKTKAGAPSPRLSFSSARDHPFSAAILGFLAERRAALGLGLVQQDLARTASRGPVSVALRGCARHISAHLVPTQPRHAHDLVPEDHHGGGPRTWLAPGSPPSRIRGGVSGNSAWHLGDGIQCHVGNRWRSVVTGATVARSWFPSIGGRALRVPCGSASSVGLETAGFEVGRSVTFVASQCSRRLGPSCGHLLDGQAPLDRARGGGAPQSDRQVRAALHRCGGAVHGPRATGPETVGGVSGTVRQYHRGGMRGRRACGRGRSCALRSAMHRRRCDA